ALTLTNGLLSIGSNVLTLNGTVGPLLTTNLVGGANSEIVVGGAGGSLTLPSVTLKNLTINRSGGSVAATGAVTVNNTLALLAGTYVNSPANLTIGNGALIQVGNGSLSGVAPVFGASVNITYNGSSPTTTGVEIPVNQTTLNNLTFDNTAGITLSSPAYVNGQLALTNGVVTTNANVLVVRAGATVARTNGYVDGNLARTFTAPGSLVYDLGAGGVYSPATVNALALSLPQAVLTVKASNQQVAGLPAAQSLQRQWAFSSSPVTSASLQFAYAQSDVPGTANEAQFRIVRKRTVDQRFTFPNGATDNVNEALNVATTTAGVTMPDRGGLYTLAQLDAPGAKAGDARSIELFDFDGGDGRTDVAIWNQNSGDWNIINSVTSATRTQADWGRQSLGDLLVPGDYDGDTKTDLAVFRPSLGNWYIIRSTTGTPIVQGWGQSGDKPVVGDFDGDGTTDLAVFRDSEGNWYVRNSGGAPPSVVKGWGTSGDVPVPADYDGDGKTDFAVFRPSDGNWYIINSATNTTTAQNWGNAGDKMVPSDYDGDGRADIAVWRPSDGNWYIRRSSDGGVTVSNWGNASDNPVPGDYDRDGRTDIAVYRSSDSNFYIVRSSDGNVNTNLFSGAGDVAVATAPQQ
ncbi:MAG TPA: FG-GAP-like repeat-containing protein, partial [Pyrinomonadaceae bacterium]